MNIDLQSISVDFIVASAHKFHGPKGVGFAYIRKFRFTTVVFLVGNRKDGCERNPCTKLRVWQKHWNFPMPNLEVEQNHITELKNI
jgi:cysteine desulfurase